jgi:hypothetical protein
MLQLLAACTQVLGLLKTVSENIVRILDILKHVPYETFPKFIENTVRDGYLLLINPFFGLHALGDKIDALGTPSVGGLAAADVGNPIYAVHVLSDTMFADYTALDGKLDSILSAIGGLPTPPTPPAVGDIAQAVWTYQIGGPTDVQAGFHLQLLDNMRSHFEAVAAFSLQTDPFLTIDAPWGAIGD